jgi:hypothetical protein
MSITLTHPTAGPGGAPLALALPPDLVWSDEFGWPEILQTTEYSSTGALHLEEWKKQAGRPITLQGGVDYAWCLRGPLKVLEGWKGQPGLVLTLGRLGVNHQVVMNHQAGAITAEPVVPYSDPIDADAYTLTLRFLQV